MFLNPTVIQLKDLELGITIDLIDRKSLEAKFFTIAAVMDSVYLRFCLPKKLS